MSDRQIDMSKLVPGGNIRFGAEHFTPELQSSIVDSYFNGGDSVHSRVLTEIHNQTQAQQPELPADVSEKLGRLSQLEQLVATPEFARAYTEVLRAGQQPQPQIAPQPNIIPQTQPPTIETQENYDPFAGLFPNEPPVNQQQNDAQQPPVATTPNEEQALEQFNRTLQTEGINPNDFVNFMGSLTPQDLIGIYRAFQAQQPPQQQLPGLQPQVGDPIPPLSSQSLPSRVDGTPNGIIRQVRPKSIWEQ